MSTHSLNRIQRAFARLARHPGARRPAGTIKILLGGALSLAACTGTQGQKTASAPRPAAVRTKQSRVGPGTVLADNLPNPAKEVMSGEALAQIQRRGVIDF